MRRTSREMRAVFRAGETMKTLALSSRDSPSTVALWLTMGTLLLTGLRPGTWQVCSDIPEGPSGFLSQQSGARASSASTGFLIQARAARQKPGRPSGISRKKKNCRAPGSRGSLCRKQPLAPRTGLPPT